MNAISIPDRLEQAKEKLECLKEARDDYSTLRDGYLHQNMPSKFPIAQPYIGAEVSEEELQEVSQTLVEQLVETEEAFNNLEDAKDTLSGSSSSKVIGNITSEELEYEIKESTREHRRTVEDIFELTEPLDKSDQFNFNMPEEYLDRMDTGHLMFDEA